MAGQLEPRRQDQIGCLCFGEDIADLPEHVSLLLLRGGRRGRGQTGGSSTRRRALALHLLNLVDFGFECLDFVFVFDEHVLVTLRRMRLQRHSLDQLAAESAFLALIGTLGDVVVIMAARDGLGATGIHTLEQLTVAFVEVCGIVTVGTLPFAAGPCLGLRVGCGALKRYTVVVVFALEVDFAYHAIQQTVGLLQRLHTRRTRQQLLARRARARPCEPSLKA
mmetsp:Transcript_4196/g.9572  ORF Transcript_4196/g.9572 Transcript_4196/m.9572 type:complete len:222 (+) Transcript_4196:793-1458(+)